MPKLKDENLAADLAGVIARVKNEPETALRPKIRGYVLFMLYAAHNLLTGGPMAPETEAQP